VKQIESAHELARLALLKKESLVMPFSMPDEVQELVDIETAMILEGFTVCNSNCGD
jgi:hypothetical protein